METLVANFVGIVRTENLQGKAHLVAPLTLIVPGVLKGSQGALFYPADEIAKNVIAWNGMPLLVRHPEDPSQQAISGRSPSILNAQGIGVVLNAEVVDGKLVAEGWFNIEDTKRVSPDVFRRLHSNQPIELSTGLWTDNTKAPANSEFNGVAYNYVARNYRPDHLAILPDDVGACSIADGCGVLNETREDGNPLEVQPQTLHGGTESNEPETLETQTFISKNKEGKMPLSKEQKTEVVGFIVANCAYCDESDKEVLNGLSDEKLETRKKGLETEMANATVVNTLQEFVGTKDVSGLPEMVINKAKNAEPVEEEEEEEEEGEGKKKFPFQKKKNKAKNKTKNADDEMEEEEDEPVKAKATKNKTDAEWLAEAPQSVRNTLHYAQEIETEQKQKLVAQIVSNIDDDAKRLTVINRLKDKDLAELRDLVALAPEPTQEEANQASYFGQQGSPTGNTRQAVENDLLTVPTMEFKPTWKTN